MRFKSALSILGDIRQSYLTPNFGKIFAADKNDLFFNRGWGDEEALQTLKQLQLSNDKPEPIEINWELGTRSKQFILRNGSFQSPFPTHLLPQESHTAHVQLVLPTNYNKQTPLHINFPMTGDQGFKYRLDSYAKPLVKKGIGTLILEAPFYGQRRPHYQETFVATTVQDILAMCACAAFEGRSLIHYFSSLGFIHLGISGVSQGGMLAAMVGTSMQQPLAIAASMLPHSPEVIFTDGILRNLVNWQALDLNSHEDGREKISQLFAMGKILELQKPHCLEATCLQGAKRDLVVPKRSLELIHNHWQGSTLNWLPGTHITSLTLHSGSFVKLVEKSFRRLKRR